MEGLLEGRCLQRPNVDIPDGPRKRPLQSDQWLESQLACAALKQAQPLIIVAPAGLPLVMSPERVNAEHEFCDQASCKNK